MREFVFGHLHDQVLVRGLRQDGFVVELWILPVAPLELFLDLINIRPASEERLHALCSVSEHFYHFRGRFNLHFLLDGIVGRGVGCCQRGDLVSELVSAILIHQPFEVLAGGLMLQLSACIFQAAHCLVEIFPQFDL